jgi:hypothetical protein
VPGDRITSEFYDPFYYLPAGYHYIDHRVVAGTLLQCWLSKTGTRLLLVPPFSSFNASVADYEAFITDNPQWFSSAGQLEEGFSIFAVNVPQPSQQACSQAAQDSAP